MDQFNPEQMRSMMDFVSTEENTPEVQNYDIVLLKFIENCLFLESQAHHWHLQCKFYSKHMELDTFYKELPEYVDDFIEGVMASRGAIENTSAEFTFQGLDSCLDVLYNFIEQCTYIHQILDELQEYGSVNTLEDVISFVNQTIYKLEVLQ